jgi:ribosomal protein S4
MAATKSLAINWKKKSQIRKTFYIRLNPYKTLFIKRRKLFLFRKKQILIKKLYKGPKPRPYFRYKFNKWKYTFLKKERYFKEKNRWFAYINLFKKYIGYRYGVSKQIVNFLRSGLKSKSQKLFFFSQKLESRLTSVLLRSGCVMNFQEASWLIKNNHIAVNSLVCSNIRYFLKPMDWISIFYLTIKNEKYRLLRFMTSYKNIVKNILAFHSGFSFFPKKYLEFNVAFTFLQTSFFKSQIIFIKKPELDNLRKNYWLYNFLAYQY